VAITHARAEWNQLRTAIAARWKSAPGWPELTLLKNRNSTAAKGPSRAPARSRSVATSSGDWGLGRGLRIQSTEAELLLPDQFPAPALIHPVLLAIPRIEKREDQAWFGRAFGTEYLSFLALFVARGPVFIDATHCMTPVRVTPHWLKLQSEHSFQRQAPLFGI
jgi:hypothetical protein